MIVYLSTAAAALLAASCVFLYRDLWNNVIDRMIVSIKKNPLGERFLDDHTFSIILTALPAFLINVAYTVYNGVIGIMNQSAWFITMAEIRELDQEKRYYTSTPELLKKYATMVPPVDDQK